MHPRVSAPAGLAPRAEGAGPAPAHRRGGVMTSSHRRRRDPRARASHREQECDQHRADRDAPGGRRRGRAISDGHGEPEPADAEEPDARGTRARRRSPSRRTDHEQEAAARQAQRPQLDARELRAGHPRRGIRRHPACVRRHDAMPRLRERPREVAISARAPRPVRPGGGEPVTEAEPAAQQREEDRGRPLHRGCNAATRERIPPGCDCSAPRRAWHRERIEGAVLAPAHAQQPGLRRGARQRRDAH